VAFDVLDRDPLAASCADAGSAGRSQVREVGDGRLLGSARRIDVTGRLVVPAFGASVRGKGVGSWLTAETLVALGRLGVARLAWRVAPAERPEALAHAAAVAGPGRPAIDVLDAGAPSRFLDLDAPPAPAASPTLESALDALTRGAWRSRAAGRPLGALLGELAGAAGADAAPLVAPDAPASLLVLRPREDAALDPARLELEAVFLDGREPGAAR
jgi:hypothetical protein